MSIEIIKLELVSKAGFTREKLNPVEMAARLGSELPGHIKFDPSLKMNHAQYKIIRQQSHDGTGVFTNQLLMDALLPLVNICSYYKPSPPDPTRTVIAVKYTIGYLWLTTVFGQVDLSAGCYPGLLERVRIPVICEFVYAESGDQNDQ